RPPTAIGRYRDRTAVGARAGRRRLRRSLADLGGERDPALCRARLRAAGRAHGRPGRAEDRARRARLSDAVDGVRVRRALPPPLRGGGPDHEPPFINGTVNFPPWKVAGGSFGMVSPGARLPSKVPLARVPSKERKVTFSPESDAQAFGFDGGTGPLNVLSL